MLRSVVAVVSGGASGLGAATASAIIRGGGRVLVADLPEAKDNFFRLAATACAQVHPISKEGQQQKQQRQQQISEGGVSCEIYHPHRGCIPIRNNKNPVKEGGPLLAFAEVDVRSEQNIMDALDLVEKEFGEPVNVAINCAGVCPARKVISSKSTPSPSNHEKDVGGGGDGDGDGDGGNIRVHSLQDFSNALEINTMGTFNLVRLAAERMAKRQPDAEGLRGCIINTASIAAFEGQTGQVAYAASKGAVVGMTLPLARDLAPHGIRVMTVAPGLFKTPLLDILPKHVQEEMGKSVPCPNRLGNPDEFARLVVSILANPMLNGETIRLDGAYRMPP